MAQRGWTAVAKKSAPRKQKQKQRAAAPLVDVPRDEWVDEWNDVERDLFVIMRDVAPRAMTAAKLAVALEAKRREAGDTDPYDKEAVGNYLYGDNMAPYVVRSGHPPGRVWRVANTLDL